MCKILKRASQGQQRSHSRGEIKKKKEEETAGGGRGGRESKQKLHGSEESNRLERGRKPEGGGQQEILIHTQYFSDASHFTSFI